MDQISERHARRKLKKQVEEYFDQIESDEIISDDESFNFAKDTVQTSSFHIPEHAEIPDAAQILNVSEMPVVIEPVVNEAIVFGVHK